MTKGKREAGVEGDRRRFIGMSKLRERWNECSHMFIERKLREDPNFPRVYRIGRRRLFALDEIEAYERASIAPRSIAPR
jgi:hypothetical protein